MIGYISRCTLCSALLVACTLASASEADPAERDLRIGIIGLDTSHAVKFTEVLNASEKEKSPQFRGCRVVAAYPKGSPDIESSVSRVPGYTERVESLGVEIVDSIDQLVTKVDAVLLETNDGRPHLEQVIPVLKARKPVFIDKPVAGSLADALAIARLAERYDTPVFSSSALRYSEGAQQIAGGAIGEITGCDAYSPCPLEPTHPDLFWYGIHGVETLYTIMGPGCEQVVRSSTASTDVVVGTWKDGRIGTFRGMRSGKRSYGGIAFGSKVIRDIGGFSGYEPLLAEIVDFLRSGEPPVPITETLEIYAFMEAADASKRRGGEPVAIAEVMKKATASAEKKLKQLAH